MRLLGAQTAGSLECDGGAFKNPNGNALNAEAAKIGGAILLRNTFNAEGEVRLHSTEARGNLNCRGGASFKNPGKTALNAFAAKFGGTIFFVTAVSRQKARYTFTEQRRGAIWIVAVAFSRTGEKRP